MNEQVVNVSITVARRLKRRTGQFGEENYEYEYDLWVIVTGPPAAQVEVTFEYAKQTPRKILLGICEDTIDTGAETLTGMVWQITGLSADDTKNLLWDLPDKVQAQIEELLRKGLAGAGSPEVLSVPVAAVGATFLLRPVLEPVERAIHVAEVIAIIVCPLIGAHVLAAGALKALMHEEISSLLAKVAASPLDGDGHTGPATGVPPAV